LLLSAAVAGALATYGTRSLNSPDAAPAAQTTALVQPARKLNAEAAARARAEWEETLRTANVRLMALQRIPEQTAPAPEVIQDLTGQQVLDLSAPPALNPTQQRSILDPAGRQSGQARPTTAARKSRAAAAAIYQSTVVEPWNSIIGPER
jgi:hypothetical protein